MLALFLVVLLLGFDLYLDLGMMDLSGQDLGLCLDHKGGATRLMGKSTGVV